MRWLTPTWAIFKKQAVLNFEKNCVPDAIMYHP